MKTGETFFQEKQYRVAAKLLTEEMSKARHDSTRARKAFLIAESYRLSNAPQLAEGYYQLAIDLGYSAKDALYQQAKMLKSGGKYDQAIELFQMHKRRFPDSDFDVGIDITGAQLAKEWVKQDNNYKVSPVAELNSPAFDYAPTIYRENALVFTSDRSVAEGAATYGWTSKKFSDFFVAQKANDGKFGVVSNFSASINSNFNEGAGCFNRQFTEFYFTRCGSLAKEDDYCKIYLSTIDESGQWSNPQMLPFVISDSINVQQPSLSADDQTLYFVTDSKDGYGGKDIWTSTKTFDGWSSPQNMGAQINTPRDEMFPFIAQDGTLYFASDGHPGMGRLDIFSASLQGGRWSVKNLQHPINSGSDDFAIIFEELASHERDSLRSKGYFSSSRPGGAGEDDIYRFIKYKVRACVVSVQVQEKIYSDTLNPNSKVLGVRPLNDADVMILASDTKNAIGVNGRTNESGNFRYNAPCDRTFRITAAKNNYFSKADVASTLNISSPDRDTSIVTVRITLDRIFRDVQIELSNIYYDLGKWNIRPDAALVLDSLVDLLKENPTLNLEIGSHTDSRADDQFNLNLSQKRAQSVVDYLVSKGINRKRLTARGYGETQLVNHCSNDVECSEEQHQQNRRTTFKVLGQNTNVESK